MLNLKEQRNVWITFYLQRNTHRLQFCEIKAYEFCVTHIDIEKNG